MTNESDWSLHKVRPLADCSGRGLWTANELTSRQDAVRIKPGSYFMTDPSGRVDPILTMYFNSKPFAKLRESTQGDYAKDIRFYLRYLARRGKRWQEVRSEDIDDYEDWRRRADANRRRIGGAKWSREVYALRHLYTWALGTGAVKVNPIVTVTVVGYDGQRAERPEVAPNDVRSQNVRWLTERAARKWIDVGLRGYGPNDVPDSSFRGRTGDRNAAYADLLFESGLRRMEAGSLLVIEVPAMQVDKPYHWATVRCAVAKYRSGRPFLLPRRTLSAIHAYMSVDRAGAVRRAQAAGTYERVVGKLVLDEVGQGPDPLISWSGDDGSSGSSRLEELTVSERHRLYVKRDAGLEPMWLWLGQDGRPFQIDSWEHVFQAASRRSGRLLGPSAPYCTPHMGRHSFALKMLVTFEEALRRRFDDSRQRDRYEALYGDPWRWVKELLGHRSIETTKNVYLGPVTDLGIRSVLDMDVGFGAEFLQVLARISGRIQDIADA